MYTVPTFSNVRPLRRLGTLALVLVGMLLLSPDA